MRVMIALENRFYKTPQGDIYSSNIFDYGVWRRYLQVFDEVVIFARLGESQGRQFDKPMSNGPNVRFFGVPMFVGPFQYLKCRREIKRCAREAVKQADAFILRIPSTVGTVLWHELMSIDRPYGVEVVGDSYDSMTSAGVNLFIRMLLQQIVPRDQRLQCLHAVAAAYVTEHGLQKRYPPGCWSTHYSSIDLPKEAIIDDECLDKKHKRLDEAIVGKRPFHICHVGTMGTLYKGQDTLIEAVSMCANKGLEFEITFLGDGKYRSSFEQKAASCGLTDYIHFVGYVSSSEEVRKYLDQADLFVLPSRQEGLPRAIIEASSRGLPCIGADVGGMGEVIGEGFLVVPDDVHGLAEKIAWLVGDENRMKEASRRNLAKAREYQYDMLNERRISFYKKVLEASASYRR